MEIVNYNNIKNMLEEHLKTRVCLDLYIKDSKSIEVLLSNIIGKVNNNLEIKDFCITILDNTKIYRYVSIDNINNKRIDNIILTVSEKPTLRIEHYEKNNNDTSVLQDNFYLYDDNCYFDSKIFISTLKNNNIENSKIKILDRVDLFTRNYYYKNYSLYKANNHYFALTVDDKETYLSNESSFNNILEISDKSIMKFLGKINDRLEEVMNHTKVKQYEIKRKHN